MHTPIADLKLVSKLRKSVGTVDLDDRFHRTDLFLDYLCENEERDFINNPELENSAFGKAKFTERIFQSYERKKQYIKSKRKRTRY